MYDLLELGWREVQEFQEVTVSQVHPSACAAAGRVPSMKEPFNLLRKGFGLPKEDKAG